MANSVIAKPDIRAPQRFTHSPKVADFDDIQTDYEIGLNVGPYLLPFSTSSANAPTSGAGFVVGFAYTATTEVQLACVAGNDKLYVRKKSGGTWGSWVQK